MDGTDQNADTTNQDIPKPPIKTYKWEDVRRSRRRGRYPWTHLTKPPFDEEVDPEEYTMDAFRRSRSTSTLGKSDTQEISEVEELEMEKSIEEHIGLPEDKENINPATKEAEPSTSKEQTKALTPAQNNGKENRAKSEEPKKKRKLSIESSYSRVSKFSLSKLGLMDKFKGAKSKIKVPKLPKRSKSDAAEANPKKQKVVTKKPKEASGKGSWMPLPPNKSPVYIHIPLKPPPGQTDEFSQLEFDSQPSSHSGSLNQLQRIGSGRKMSLLGLLTEIKKVHELQKQRQTSESKQSPLSEEESKMEVDVEKAKQVKGNLKPETKKNVDDQSSVENEPRVELVESMDSAKSEPEKLDVGQASVQRKESDRLVITELMDDDRKSTKSTKSSKSTDGNKPSKPRTPEPIVLEPEDSSNDDNVSQYLDKDDKCEIVSEKSANVSSDSINQAGPSKTQEAVRESQDPENARRLEVTLSKWKKQVPASSPTIVSKLPAVETQRERAKSEEPKRKRRSSVESSYSRKSLSKLAFIKRLKEATDKIKLPKFPSFAKTDRKDSKKSKSKTPEEVKKPEPKHKAATKKSEVPVYIHIPLKLPPGQTDEFSHLAEETEKPVVEPEEPKKEEEVEPESESSVPTSPDVPGSAVQLIILTPPSDDEILDANVPETPSETDQKFFEVIKIDDLKNLAKKAVDTICPDKKLETVTEDEGSDEQSAPESSQEIKDDETQKDEKMEVEPLKEKEVLSQKQQQILVDEEDGLKLSDAAIAMINEEMAKEAKSTEEAKDTKEDPDLKSSLKKKVSFKRRSRAEDGERIYEDVQLSKDPAKVNEDPQAKLKPLESFQSMSVDEEKSYLDKKVIKDTSLEDDYNKWSKSNDHEYEPVNPPPEDVVPRGPPVVHITDINRAPEKSVDSSERHFVRIPPDEELIVHSENEAQGLDDNMSTQEAQRRIEDRFFNATPETTRTSSRTDGELNTSQVDSSALEMLPLKKESRKKSEDKGKGFNETLRTQAGKLKTKWQGIKKPNITLPKRPKFSTGKFKKPEFKKPTFKMPKMPERPSINLPSFSSLTRRESAKDSWRDRQLSTESNAGDSTKKIFDFRTYPRIFDKYRKSKEKTASPAGDDREPTPPPPEFATVPRVGKKKGSVSSRWASKFKDIKHADENARRSKEFDNEGTQDVIRIPLHPDNEDPMDVPSHTRYNEDIDIEDDYDRENRDIHRASPFSRDYLKRWNHGEFHEDPLSHPLQYGQEIDRGGYRVTDLDNDVEETPPGGSFEIEIPHPKEEHSSGSLSEHRRGVLEEIDSDEFFLREKGISQDNIEVGKYLSSEIREAFRNPVNALSQLQSEDREYDLDVSDQSEPLQDAPRRKPLRKPKRKKTPHVSKEQISYDRESVTTEPEEYPKPFDEFKSFAPPSRPKRKSKKGKKKKPTADDVIPYQETIPIEEPFRASTPTDQVVEFVNESHILPGNILEENPLLLYDKGYPQMYENEHMRGIEQPDIKVSDPYYRYENFQQDIDKFLDDNEPNGAPIAPTRKHRSLKSLNASEADSIIEEIKMSKEIPQQNVEAYRAEQEYIIPTPEPPKRPGRMRSRTQSQSGASQQEDDRTSRGADSLISDTQPEAVEEPCMVDMRDSMGYAVIDKSRLNREPPLPPLRIPSTPPRTRRSKKGTPKPDKFSTVPRSVNDRPPVRPLRNYSTLGGSSRTSRSKSPTSVQGEEKENIDLGQYIEIEDGEPVRRLQSGDVIQKMRDRPLPAPPRPPRRPRRPTREVFRDISHERNIPSEPDFDKMQFEETQTEPAAEGYISEEQPPNVLLADIEQQIIGYEHEETITHGSLVVQPIDNAQILPYSELTKQSSGQPPVERTITVTREYIIPTQQISDDEETSEIPEEFTKLRDPPPKPAPRREQKSYYDATEESSEIPEEFARLKNPPPRAAPPNEEKVHQSSQEVGILKAQKMQVSDLDVDKLRVNELQANKIIVSELDGISLQVTEINSKSGNLVLSGIELPPHLIQEMLDKLQATAHEQASFVAEQSASPQSSETQTVKPESTREQAKQTHDNIAESEQKKTPIEDDLPINSIITEEAPPVPPRYDSKTDLLDENLDEPKELEPEQEVLALPSDECQEETTLVPPTRPPRKSSQIDKSVQNLEELDEQQPQLESQVLLQKESELQNGSQDPLEPPYELEVLPIYPPESSDSLPAADNTSKSEDEPPPRPPQPITQQDYVPSQPPASFYALRSAPFADFVEEDIPMAPRRKRHHKAPPVSRSSSDEVPPAPRRHHRSPEPSIPQLTGQLVGACASEMDRSIKGLISHITNNVFHNADGKQDLHVMILILLILIAGLILLSGDDKVTIHHHHWEFFNPPKDL